MPGLISEDPADTDYEIEVGMSWAVFWNFLGKFIDNPNAILRSSNVFSGPASKGARPYTKANESTANHAFEMMTITIIFTGAGFLALFVPWGLEWGPSKLCGLFTYAYPSPPIFLSSNPTLNSGLSALGAILVYLFVPGTDRVSNHP